MAVVPREHEAFIAYRATLRGLGASDAPAALGVSRFTSPFELWARLTGRTAPEPGDKRTRRGLRLEPVAAAWYTEETGRKLRRIGRTIREPRFPHVFAHPDRRASDRLVEIKTAWRDYRDGVVPVDVDAQVTVESALTHLPIVDVALMTFEELHIHELRPDPEVAAELCEWLDAWYVRHIEGDTPPKDGSQAYSRYLDGFVREIEEKATAEQTQLMTQLRTLRRGKKAAEAGEDAVLIALKESMAGATLLVGDGFRVSWRPTKGRKALDLKALGAAHPALVAEFTTVTDPGRQFRPTWTTDEEEEKTDD